MDLTDEDRALLRQVAQNEAKSLAAQASACGSQEMADRLAAEARALAAASAKLRPRKVTVLREDVEALLAIVTPERRARVTHLAAAEARLEAAVDGEG